MPGCSRRGPSSRSLSSHQLAVGTGLYSQKGAREHLPTSPPWPCPSFPSRLPPTKDWKVALMVGVTDPACVARSLAFRWSDSSAATDWLPMPASPLWVPRGTLSPNLSVLTAYPPCQAHPSLRDLPGQSWEQSSVYNACVNTGWMASVHPASWKPHLPAWCPHLIKAS